MGSGGPGTLHCLTAVFSKQGSTKGRLARRGEGSPQPLGRVGHSI